MVGVDSTETMTKAFLESNADYNGVFVVAVKTTGIFCKPSCPARKPLLKNIEFFERPGDALYAGYRPCKRCRPMEPEGATPEFVQKALDLLNGSDNARIMAYELRSAGLSPDRLRRYFQKHYGMTFQAYARGQRLGKALAKIREGRSVIEATVETGYESTSGFRAAFTKAFGFPPSEHRSHRTLTLAWLDTPLGAMVAGADEAHLYLLEFIDRRMLGTQLEVLQRHLKCGFEPGMNPVLEQTQRELSEYFDGKRQAFAVPMATPGSAFQHRVWKELIEIPYGKTSSYGEIADRLGSVGAQRAVGKANGENRIAIFIPCHRVIRADGTLCGYGGGLWRKQRLLELETGQATTLF